MTPKEQALDMLIKMSHELGRHDASVGDTPHPVEGKQTAKRCCIIMVDEIIKTKPRAKCFWDETKKEIEAYNIYTGEFERKYI